MVEQMREIVFRGRAKGGMWVIGNLIWYPDVNRAYITTGDYFKGKAVEVERLTVGQYTGMKDRNGRRIFEGDILKEQDIAVEGEIQIPGSCYTVEMRKGVWAIIGEKEWDFLHTNAERCEVVGNVYEN